MPWCTARRTTSACVTECVTTWRLSAANDHCGASASSGGPMALARTTFEAGKALVTANKAMIAHHGLELATKAEAAKVALKFEAAVAGGIPVIKALKEGAAANHIDRVYGILNGTCNYILSTMEDTGRDFADVLAEAQAKGGLATVVALAPELAAGANLFATGADFVSLSGGNSLTLAAPSGAILSPLLNTSTSCSDNAWAWPGNSTRT
jgi:hypothetical protein